MYFSRLTLKQSDAFFALMDTDKHSLYTVHQLLWQAFDKDPDAERDFLFRSDELAGVPRYFVVSARKPINKELFDIETKEYEPQFREGERLQFTLLANPIVKVRQEGKKNSSKHDVWMHAKKQARQQGLSEAETIEFCRSASISWLDKKGKSNGFDILPTEVCVNSYNQHRLYQSRKNRQIKVSSIMYEGFLEITDLQAFKESLFNGLGSSKGFGFGLLLVRRT